MQIATRWAGWCGIAVGAAAAMGAIGVAQLASSWRSESAFSTTMTYRGYVIGADRSSRSDWNAINRQRDEEAFAWCMDTWPGKLQVRAVPSLPGATSVHVEEGSPLDRCLQVRQFNGSRFQQGVWTSEPPDVTLNVPARRGSARPYVFDEFRDEREQEAAMVADGTSIVMSCPARGASTFVGLPTPEFMLALSKCWSRVSVPGESRFIGWSRLALDEAGTVVRVITSPPRLRDVPCIMATACGARFPGLGAGLSI